MRFAWLLSLCIGFLSLSQEILWVRYAGFAYYSVPQAFSFVLGVFLLGIASGALLGKLICTRTTRLLTVSGGVLLAAGALDMCGPLLAAPALAESYGLAVLAPLIFLCAALKGSIFPIVHQLGSTTAIESLGRSVSRVYFFNIIGSTLGPLVTGFVLLDHLGLQQAMLLLGWLTGVAGIVCIAREQPLKAVAVTAIPLLLLAGLALREDRLITTLAFSYGHRPIVRVIENKSGVLHVVHYDKGGDMVYGGNVYDGRTNIDPRVNSNGLERVFVLAALKPEPRNVLVIGLSTGAWARIVSGFPGVEHIDAVEINPGYIELIRGYPELAPLLSDPRVTVDIDDARRWLRRHTERRYDLIVMNTTLHWRAYSTNLLSREYLQLIRAHLLPGGVITYNATGSADVLRTAEEVFPYAFRYASFVVASDVDFRVRLAGAQAQLYRVAIDGKPVLDPNLERDRAFVHDTLATPFVSSRADHARMDRDLEIITDWNLLPEYKYGREFPCVRHGLDTHCSN